MSAPQLSAFPFASSGHQVVMLPVVVQYRGVARGHAQSRGGKTIVIDGRSPPWAWSLPLAAEDWRQRLPIQSSANVRDTP
eukprot:2634579-Pyramimonas_sp.AAC.1